MFTEENYPIPSAVDETFDHEMALILRGGEKIQLLELKKPGISTNKTVARIKSINSLIVGDLIHNKTHAWLEGGIINGDPKANKNSWIEDLYLLKIMFSNDTKVYGGRGKVGRLAKSID